MSLNQGKSGGEVHACPRAQTDFEDSELRSLLLKLPREQRQVIYGLYVVGLSQAEIGRQLGVGQQQVSRLKKAALDALRREIYV